MPRIDSAIPPSMQAGVELYALEPWLNTVSVEGALSDLERYADANGVFPSVENISLAALDKQPFRKEILIDDRELNKNVVPVTSAEFGRAIYLWAYFRERKYWDFPSTPSDVPTGCIDVWRYRY